LQPQFGARKTKQAKTKAELEAEPCSLSLVEEEKKTQKC
jgi:hypothetical protein